MDNEDPDFVDRAEKYLEYMSTGDTVMLTLESYMKLPVFRFAGVWLFPGDEEEYTSREVAEIPGLRSLDKV